jgi:hypothetical protein
MSVRQSGVVLWVLADFFRGDGWGDVGGDWGICFHWVVYVHIFLALSEGLEVSNSTELI